MSIDTITRPPSSWRVPNVARRPATAFDFVPVIFGNGEDDDLPGIIAMLNNEAVQYGEHVHVPGEDVSITGCLLRMSKHVAIQDDSGVRAALDFTFETSWDSALQRPDVVPVANQKWMPRFIKIVGCTIHVEVPK